MNLPRPHMIWFWRSELQGGLQSINCWVIVQQWLESEAFTAGYDLSQRGALADSRRCDLIIRKKKRITYFR